MRNHGDTWVIWYICLWRVTEQWLIRWCLTSDPLTERATSNYSQTRCLCEDLKIVGKAGKKGTRLGLQDDFQNKLLIWPARGGPLCLLLLQSGTGMHQQSIDWTVDLKNTSTLQQWNNQENTTTMRTATQHSHSWKLDPQNTAAEKVLPP